MAAKKKKCNVSLSVKKGEKLSASAGAGLTAKGTSQIQRRLRLQTESPTTIWR
jgi:hypothetical protein